jgi:hypothetical protein
LKSAADEDIFARLDTFLDVAIGDGFAIKLINGNDRASYNRRVCSVASLDWRASFPVKSSMVMLRLSDCEGCSAE